MRGSGSLALVFGLLLAAAWTLLGVSSTPVGPARDLARATPLPSPASSAAARIPPRRHAVAAAPSASPVSAAVAASWFDTDGRALTDADAVGMTEIVSPLLGIPGLRAGAPIRVCSDVAPILGRVVDCDGHGVEGAEVVVDLEVRMPSEHRLDSVDIHRHRATATTPGGWFRIPDAPIAAGSTLVVRSVGYEAARLGLHEPPRDVLFRLRAAEPERFDGACPATSALDPEEGPARAAPEPTTLLDEHGARCPRWWVGVVGFGEDDRYAAAPVETDDRGGFRLGLASGGGPARIEAWDPTTGRVGWAEVAPGAAIPTLRLRPLRAASTLSGRVVDAAGRPVSGARVGLGRPGAWALVGWPAMQLASIAITDHEGRFVVENGGRPAFELRIDGDGIVPARADAARFAGDGVQWVVRRLRWLHLGQELGPLAVSAIDAGAAPSPLWVEGEALPWGSIEWRGAGAVGVPAGATLCLASANGRSWGRLRLR